MMTPCMARRADDQPALTTFPLLMHPVHTYTRFGAFTCFLAGPVVLLIVAAFSLARR